MQIGNVTLKIGHGDVVIAGVTPAECVLLSHADGKIGHAARAKCFPLSKLTITGDAGNLFFDTDVNVWMTGVKPNDDYDASDPESKRFISSGFLRTDKEEYARLYRKYGKKKVEVIYPASAAKLPTYFADVGGWEDERDVETVKRSAAKAAPEPKAEPPKGSRENPYVSADEPKETEGRDGDYQGCSKNSTLYQKMNGKWEKVVIKDGKQVSPVPPTP